MLPKGAMMLGKTSLRALSWAFAVTAVGLAVVPCANGEWAGEHEALAAPPKLPKPGNGGGKGWQPKPAVPKGYAQNVKVWHAPSERPLERDEVGRIKFALSILNTGERLSFRVRDEDAGLSAVDHERLSHLLRDPRTGGSHPIDPRVIRSVYRIQSHFEVPELRVISGYRLPPPGGHSNHGRGRAIDLVVPGVKNEDVAKFAREMGFTGVGVYPVSGFVHIDMREHSYFWVDTSGPGGRKREQGILGPLASQADAAAKARGEKPPAPYTVLLDVDAALKNKASTVSEAPPDAPHADDDDEM
jgi:uncharacterized protein YcbK (DUF882 family)